MYQEFVILTLETNLLEKKIIVTTNNEIDPNSIDDIHIEIIERETKGEVQFTKEIKGSSLEVTLTQWPIPNSVYIFYLKSVKNILGEELRAGIRRKIHFRSTVTKEVEIISPSMHELVKSFNVKFKLVDIIKEDEENKVDYNIVLEVSSDNVFNNIVKSTKIHDKKEITIAGLKPGQYFLRSRVETKDSDIKFQYSKWSETLSVVYDKEKCTILGEDNDIDYTPEYDDMLPIIDDIADFEVTLLNSAGVTTDNFLFMFNKDLNEDNFHRSQIMIIGKKGAIKHNAKVFDNMIQIDLIDELNDNSIYDIKLMRIESVTGDNLTQTFKFATSMKPFYVDIDAVNSLIGEHKIPEETIMYHIKEASKFADYLASSDNMIINEDNIPFPVTQLVKYFAAHECLLRHTIDLSSTLGIQGTVGNVSFNEREQTKDINNLLKHFCREVDKWKDAVRGYENEGRAKIRTGVKGVNGSNTMTPFKKNMNLYGRGDLYGRGGSHE